MEGAGDGEGESEMCKTLTDGEEILHQSHEGLQHHPENRSGVSVHA